MSTGSGAPHDETVDVDELVHREEEANQPPAIPPDQQEDFEKAVRGETGAPTAPQIIPNNPD